MALSGSLPWLRRLPRWVLVCLCAVLMGGCTGDCSLWRGPLLPTRGAWPTLEIYPGAALLSPELATPRRQTYWAFKTTASLAQVRAYYRALLEPQGWRNDSNGTLTDFRACPKLTLDIRASRLTTGEPFYEVELIETACPPSYC